MITSNVFVGICIYTGIMDIIYSSRYAIIIFFVSSIEKSVYMEIFIVPFLFWWVHWLMRCQFNLTKY